MLKRVLRKLNFQNIFKSKFSSSLNISTWISPDNGYDSGIKVYNCLTKGKVPLILRNKELATWYTCGPTVYDSAHIGHASCYVKLDIIQRILKNYFNIELITAMNITDIDDKIIKKAKETTVTNFQDISKKYEIEFWNDLKSLNIQEPNIVLRVTENIPFIIQFTEKLLKNDQAYLGKDNSVYFAVDKYKNYGKLQKLILDDNNKRDKNKRADTDFALWKSQLDENKPNWKVPWSLKSGRPGWHIECSALATKIFGDKIDFHAGGLDLKFPHHENEEAQSCCYHNSDQWVNYWIHTGQLKLEKQSEKMSKSLQNTISIQEFLQKYSANDFRMMCLLSNYKNSIEFSYELMALASTTLNCLKSFISDCEAYIEGKKRIGTCNSNEILLIYNQAKTSINSALKDDFDTSKCVMILNELTNNVNKIVYSDEETYSASSIAEIVAVKQFLQKILNIFGFGEKHVSGQISSKPDVYDLVNQMLDVRHNIRKVAIETKNKNLFNICDNIRDILKEQKIQIKDHEKGSSWNIN